MLNYIPIISAQEDEFFQEEIPPVVVEDTVVVIEDPLRAVEQSYVLADDNSVVPVSAVSSIWVIIRTILTLAIVAVAIYGIVYFLKKSSGKIANKDPFLKVLASTHLGSGRYAHVVSVGTRAWLVGCGDGGGVRPIGEIEDKDLLDAMLLEEARKSTQETSTFSDFKSIISRFGITSEQKNSTADEIRKRRERLKGL